jgi:hypothetical protein
MASPLEMLGEMAAAIGDLPEKLVSALKGAESPAPMPLETGGRIPLPMAGEQVQPRQQQPAPSAFPMPQPLALPSSLPAPQASPMPQGIPAQTQPSISPITVPAGQAMPSGLPSASMPSPTSPNAGLFGAAGLFGKAGAQSEDRNDERMVELLEEISDKLDKLIAANKPKDALQTPEPKAGKNGAEPIKYAPTENNAAPSMGKRINWGRLFGGKP